MGLLDAISSINKTMQTSDNWQYLLGRDSGMTAAEAREAVMRQKMEEEYRRMQAEEYARRKQEFEMAKKAAEEKQQKEAISKAMLQSMAAQGGMGKFQSPEIQGLLRPFAAAQGDPAMLEQGGLLAPQGGSELTTYAKNLILAGKQPGTPEFEQAMMTLLTKPRSTVNVNSGPTMPDLPAGYMWRDPTNPSAGVAPLPGGPHDNAETRAAAQQARLAKVESTIAEIDKALPAVSNWTAGAGSLLSAAPGTPAKDLSGALTTIKANIGFDELQAMRAASPTGGALGQVAVQELEALQSSIASLNQEQSPERLAENLEKVRRHYSRWLSAKNGQDPNLSYPVPGAQSDLRAAAAAELARRRGR